MLYNSRKTIDTVIINDKFAYSNESVILHGVTYPISEIKEIGFSTLKTKINLVPTGTSYNFILIMDDEANVVINNSLGFFTKKMINKLGHAYTYLKKTSSKDRYNKYLEDMNSQGYFEYNSGFSKSQFYSNGDIVKRNKRINIKKAQKEGFIWYGTARGIPGAQHYSTNPTQVTISESKRKYFNSKKISIDFPTNSDVLFSIIKKLAYD